MAISRLLRLKPRGLHFNGRGLIPSTNSYSSSSFSSGGSEKSSFSEGLKATKEVKAGDKEQKKESWTWFKGIVSNVKQKMLESSWLQKSIAGDASDSKVDTKASEVTVTENSSHYTESLESLSVTKSPEVVMSSPGGTEGVSSCSASDTIGGNAFEGLVVNATSELCKMHNNPDNVGLGDVQSIVSHGNEKDKLRTLATDVMVENSLKVNKSRNLSDIFGLKLENDVKRMKLEAMSNVFEASSGKPVTFVDGTNDLSEITNHLPGNGTATFVRRTSASSIPGKNHASSKSSSRTLDLINIMSKKQNDPTAGEMAGYLHDTPAPVESSKGKKIENIKIDAIIEEMTEVLGEQLPIKPQERTVSNVTSQHSIGGFLKNVQSTANLQNSDVKRTLIKKVLEDERTSKARERKILNVTDERSNGGFHNTVPSPASLKNSDVKLRPLLKLLQENFSIKAQDRTILNVTDQSSNGEFLNSVQRLANLQNSDVKRGNTLLKQHHMNSGDKMQLDKKEKSSIPTEYISSDEEDSNLNLTNSDHVKPGPNSHVSYPVCREELNSHSQTSFIKKEGYKDNKVLVRFLTKNVGKQDILTAFSDCGPIVNVEELSSTKESLFKDFLVQFETRKGSKIALKKKDLIIMNAEAFVEPTSSEVIEGVISFPDLIGYPDTPIALLKNPTKTVKIKHLSEDISSQQLKEALAFCNCDISNIFSGPTSSVVYVEFETEDAKERALAQQSVLISGKELPILRVDAPMTTVVRISNTNPNSKIQAICSSYGQVKLIVTRHKEVVDVHFKLAELPNMLRIVNSLNGIKVDGNQWLAQPAPVFPPEILRALWHRPEERRHVNAVFYKLLREIEKPISTTKSSQFTNLATRYFGKEF